MEIRENIQRICKEKNIKINEMLRDCELGANYINQLNDPKISKLIKICNYLNVDINEILKNE